MLIIIITTIIIIITITIINNVKWFEKKSDCVVSKFFNNICHFTYFIFTKK